MTCINQAESEGLAALAVALKQLHAQGNHKHRNKMKEQKLSFVQGFEIFLVAGIW